MCTPVCLSVCACVCACGVVCVCARPTVGMYASACVVVCVITRWVLQLVCVCWGGGCLCVGVCPSVPLCVYLCLRACVCACVCIGVCLCVCNTLRACLCACVCLCTFVYLSLCGAVCVGGTGEGPHPIFQQSWVAVSLRHYHRYLSLELQTLNMQDADITTESSIVCCRTQQCTAMHFDTSC